MIITVQLGSYSQQLQLHDLFCDSLAQIGLLLIFDKSC